MAKKKSFGLIITVLERNGVAFRMDVECQEKGYSFKFWDVNDKPGEHGHAQAVVRQMNYFNADFWDGGVFKKEFEYPSEVDDLYQYIAAFTEEFAAVSAG